MSGIISDNVGRSSGLLKAVAVAAGGATDAEAANIMINSFNIAAAGGFAYQNMVDGVVDAFEDETGIDTSTSTNEGYDATNDLYVNGTAADSSAEDTASAAVYSGNTVREAASNAALLVKLRDGTIDENGVFYVQSAGGTAGLTWTFEQNFTELRFASMTNSGLIGNFSIEIFDGDSTWTKTAITGWTEASSVYNTDEATATAATGYHKVTFSAVNGFGIRMNVSSTTTGNGNGTICEFVITTSALTNNMTLVSNATTARSAPSDANIVIWQQDVTAITLNTDLKAYASRNGGTTYTQMTLAEVADTTIGRILTGTVDISGQSSATAMKYKIETLNTKSQKIHAVALQWS